MNKVTVNTFKVLLLTQKDELISMSEIISEAASPVKLDQASVGRLSRMDAMQAQSMAQEVVRRRKTQLVRIEGALRRIEADNYGYCSVCEEDIDVRRLEFDPTATKCVSCEME